MIETRIMEGEEVELTDLTAKTSLISELPREKLEELLEVFKAGYGDDWLGDDLFWNVRLKNATELLELRSENRMAAAILFDNLRILQVTVHPDFQGHGLGVKLLQEAAEVHPEAWISVALDANAVLATVADPRLNYLPVEDKDKIEELLKNINGSKGHYQVDAKEVPQTVLSEKFASKGLKKDKFIAFAAKEASTHGQGYYQILFQNKLSNP